jgi:fucokinase
LFNQVLVVEQMLTSGGGWQDQVGAVVPGFKLTTTQPGIPQHFQVERLELGPETLQELSERLLLVYTGQQRVARNILELVVADWLSRREDLVATLSQLREDAYAMREALVGGDVETFGGLLTRYWEGKKVLNAHTTNATIDALLERVADLCSGYGIAGAGGGGFLVLLARDAAGRAQIEQRLKSTPTAVYPWELAE